MGNIKWLEITFENIDWVRIPGRYILNLELNKQSAPIDVGETMLVSDTFHATEMVFILLSNNILSKKARYRKDWSKSSRKDIVLRLKQNDITSVDVCYDDGTTEHHYVMWKDAPNNEYVNQNQKVFTDTNGNIAISISEDNG